MEMDMLDLTYKSFFLQLFFYGFFLPSSMFSNKTSRGKGGKYPKQVSKIELLAEVWTYL
jgi:hypothetical protein